MKAEIVRLIPRKHTANLEVLKIVLVYYNFFKVRQRKKLW